MFNQIKNLLHLIDKTHTEMQQFCVQPLESTGKVYIVLL